MRMVSAVFVFVLLFSAVFPNEIEPSAVPPSSSAGSLLVLQTTSGASNDSVSLLSYSPLTGKFLKIVAYHGYRAGTFKGIDVSGQRVFAVLCDQPADATACKLLTLDVAKGVVLNAVDFPPSVDLATAWSPFQKALVGLYMDNAANNLTLGTVDPETGQVTDIMFQYNPGNNFEYAVFDPQNYLMFSNPTDTDSAVIVTIQYSTGEVLQTVDLPQQLNRPAYNANASLIVDSGFYSDMSTWGLYSADPTTGDYTSLGISLVTGITGITVGPCAVDPLSQTYFSILTPSGGSTSLYQVDLYYGDTTHVVRTDPVIWDMLWAPGNSA